MIGRAAPALLLLAAAAGCTHDEPLVEGAFVVLLDAAPGSLDPRFALSDYGAKIGQLVFSSLVTFDTADGQPEFDLATEIEVISNTCYEVTIRGDVRFHDGHPLTSEDVVYTFASLAEVGSPLAGDFGRIAVTALDDFTLRFDLPEPRGSFLADLRMGIVPAHILAERPDGQFLPGEALVGSGPFRYAGRRGDHEVALRANPDYYGGAPPIAALSFRLLRDDNARLLTLLGGTADLVQNAVPPLLLPVVERYPQLRVERAPSFKVTYIAFNTRHPILADRRVRQAISCAIDRAAIIEQKFAGMAQLATGLLAPQHWAYEGEVARWDYDPERARALLDAAGFPSPPDGGPRFTLVFKVSANRFRRAIAQLIAHQLGEVGVAVEVRAYEWGTFFADVRAGNFEMATLQWPSVVDPDHFRYVFHSSSIPWEGGQGGNRGGYVNPELDRLLEAGRVAAERHERRAIYSEVQRILAEDAPYVNLWHEDNFVVLRQGVEGYQMTPNARFRYLVITEPAP